MLAQAREHGTAAEEQQEQQHSSASSSTKQNEARPCVSKQRQQIKRQWPTSGRRASRCRGKLCSRARAADRERAWGAADCAVAAVSPKLRSREKHAERATAAAPAQEIGPSDQRPTLHPHHRTSYGWSASNPLSRPSLAPSPPLKRSAPTSSPPRPCSTRCSLSPSSSSSTRRSLARFSLFPRVARSIGPSESR